MNRDLTVGQPKKVLWQFCLPLFASVIFQQLYNLADSFVAGRFLGEHALAAVGNSYEVTLIFIAFAFGCNMGCSVVVSTLFGAKDYKNMKTAVYTALITTVTTCVALMALGLLGGKAFLRLINTPEVIFEDSALYLDIYTLGLPFLFLYNVSTGIFSALGDSKTPFVFLAVSSTLNILVDILFVTAFHMGVDGVAWATFLCQGVSCVLSVLVVFRRLEAMETEEKPELFSSVLFRRILAVAIPSTLQQSFISIGNIILQSVINSFGPSVIAGYAAGVKINNMFISGLTTLGNGMSNYTAQNKGAGKMDRIRDGFKAGLQLVWTLAIPVALLYFFVCRPILLVFMDTTATDAIKTGMIY
ncbi:MAG: MATE family efflux transporter, partial [Spirochaetales bacterium]|nr:MATE family efflux transporter [Candidatus Physcosoma equi]